MNNIKFTMYEPSTGSIIINAGSQSVFFIHCDLFNQNVIDAMK